MWLEYTLKTPYFEPTREYYESHSSSLSEAEFDLRTYSGHRGDISNIVVVDKPPIQYVEQQLTWLELKAHFLQRDIEKLKGYLNDG